MDELGKFRDKIITEGRLVEGVRGAFTYYINEEDGDTLRDVHINCDCGFPIHVGIMQGQDLVECPGCDARYTGVYKGWQLMKLREEASEADVRTEDINADC